MVANHGGSPSGRLFILPLRSPERVVGRAFDSFKPDLVLGRCVEGTDVFRGAGVVLLGVVDSETARLTPSSLVVLVLLPRERG